MARGGTFWAGNWGFAAGSAVGCEICGDETGTVGTAAGTRAVAPGESPEEVAGLVGVCAPADGNQQKHVISNHNSEVLLKDQPVRNPAKMQPTV